MDPAATSAMTCSGWHSYCRSSKYELERWTGHYSMPYAVNPLRPSAAFRISVITAESWCSTPDVTCISDTANCPWAPPGRTAWAGTGRPASAAAIVIFSLRVTVKRPFQAARRPPAASRPGSAWQSYGWPSRLLQSLSSDPRNPRRSAPAPDRANQLFCASSRKNIARDAICRRLCDFRSGGLPPHFP